MEVATPHSQETVPRGRLYLLSHPGSDIFSGYGITLRQDKPDLLAGVLMVDRPAPVDPAWLQEIEARYGAYELALMTRAGERGLVTQMHIAPDSLPYLVQGDSPLIHAIEDTLKPLLEYPPAPILKLQWDAAAGLWSSSFWVGLSPALQRVFDAQGPGCLALERDRRVTFVSHVADDDLPRLYDAQVLGRWELFPMATAPLIRFHAGFLERSGQMYFLEHFLNVGDSEQARYLGRLMSQEELVFDLFGSDYEYAYTKVIAHQPGTRRLLDELVRQAVDLYGAISPQRRDFDSAKAEFLRRYPLGWTP